MTEAGSRNKPPRRPRDAATLIIVDRSRAMPRILMGRRRPDQVFLPNKYVFPGGALDKTDRYIKHDSDLSQIDLEKLLIDMKGRPSIERARTLALTAIRESYEETGLLFANPAPREAKAPQTSSNPVWQQIFDHGYTPSLNGFKFMARAITPPGLPRRFDTRFFCVDATHICRKDPPVDNELLDQDWYAVAEMRMLDLPHITRAIVEDLDDWLQIGGNSSPGAPPVTYYYYSNGAYERQIIKSQADQS